MEDFCYLQHDQGLCDRLAHAIRGSGAFRRFRAAIEREGLLDTWYEYKKRRIGKSRATGVKRMNWRLRSKE
jgi:hypothetical protein